MANDEKILVTGAAGFIGKYVLAELSKQSLSCLAVDVLPCSTGEWRQCDLSNNEALRSIFASHNFRVVIHLAAMLPTASTREPFAATQANILASSNLLACATEFRVPRFVFGSSTSVYGLAGTEAPITEEAAAAPRDLYGAAKRYTEILGEVLRQRQALEFVSLRMATVVGTGARNTASRWRSEIFEALEAGSSQSIALPYYEGDLLTLVHVEDVAAMLVLLATTERISHSVYNTPAELWSAGELKRAVEGVSPKISISRIGSKGPVAPLANGTRFSEEFRLHATSLIDRMKESLA
ncbi:MAG TPA: NAD(P)-dependent oxidoreductase [Terriglobales bacterium]|nr:NAD(P)-dependent oxidoreductase [Terriglobales bacterium]